MTTDVESYIVSVIHGLVNVWMGFIIENRFETNVKHPLYFKRLSCFG